MVIMKVPTVHRVLYADGGGSVKSWAGYIPGRKEETVRRQPKSYKYWHSLCRRTG